MSYRMHLVRTEFRVDLEHYVSVLGGKFNICNRDRCIDTSVTLGDGGVPVDHRLGTWALGRDPRMYAAKRI